jgi:hypothetical protein
MVVAPRVLGERDVVLVDVDRHAELASRAFGEPDVVEVRVREDHGADLARAAAEGPQRLVQGVPRARHSRVHDGQPVVSLEDVPVGAVVLDPMDSWSGVGVQHG